MASSINSTSTGSGGLISTGDDSGILNIQTNEITAITVDASQKVSFTNPIQGGSITSGTAVASTSGTSIDFTSIPSWVKRITVMFNQVTTNSSSYVIIQIGSGSVTTSGYVAGSSLAVGSSANVASQFTTGFGWAGGASSSLRSGMTTISLLGSNIYVCQIAGAFVDATNGLSGGGTVTLGGVLDRVRITTVNGTDTFDGGSINIMYEG